MASMDPWLQGRTCTQCHQPLRHEGLYWRCGCADLVVSDLNLMVGMEAVPWGWRWGEEGED